MLDEFEYMLATVSRVSTFFLPSRSFSYEDAFAFAHTDRHSYIVYKGYVYMYTFFFEIKKVRRMFQIY